MKHIVISLHESIHYRHTRVEIVRILEMLDFGKSKIWKTGSEREENI